jgi:PAS domain S-box-containing protein
LFVSGEIAAEHIALSWRVWWLGDAMGDLLIAPAMLVWLVRPQRSAPGTRIEGATLAVAAAAIGIAVFYGGQWEYPYALFPLLVWAVLRFHHRGVTAVVLLLSGFALWATLDGSLPVGGINERTAVSILQALMSIVSISMLMLAATITERELAAANLRKSEELSRAIFENSAVGIALADPSGRFVTVNRIHSDMLGYSEEELQTLSIADVIHPDELEAHSALLRELIGGHRDWFAVEERHIRKDGSVCWVRNTVSLLRNDDGRPQFVIVVLEDVSERRRLEDARDQFIARASHELRTPLTSVVGFARLLSGNRVVDDTTREEIIEQLDGQARRLTTMVGHLLDLTALQQRRLRISPQPVGVASLVKRAVAATPAPTEKRVTGGIVLHRLRWQSATQWWS